MIIEYQALDLTGSIVTDTLTVADTAEAYTELKRRGLTPVRVTQSKNTNQHADGFLGSLLQRFSSTNAIDPRKARRKHLIFFTTQLTILVETGTPIAASLGALESQFTCPHWGQLISLLRQHVEEGTTLAAAMSQYPEVFDKVYTNMVAAGESSGNLNHILTRLSAMTRQSDRLRSRIIAAMIYPTLLTTISISVLCVLIFFVLPRFEAVFEDMNVDLPGSTKALLAVSNTVRNHMLFTIFSVAAVVTGAIYWLRTEHGRRFVMRYSLRVPVAGPLICSINMSRLLRLLGLMVDSSIPLLEALELTAAATKNYLYAELMEKLRANVIDGQPMYPVLEHSPLVAPGISQMVRTGEENSRLGMVVGLLADHLDEDNETKVNTLTSIMEPVILIVMGFVVGTVALSLVLPMFDLTSIG